MKSPVGIVALTAPTSPPSRGAWIEMVRLRGESAPLLRVAPLAGGVD